MKSYKVTFVHVYNGVKFGITFCLSKAGRGLSATTHCMILGVRVEKCSGFII
jgi:hypothetical protein